MSHIACISMFAAQPYSLHVNGKKECELSCCYDELLVQGKFHSSVNCMVQIMYVAYEGRGRCELHFADDPAQ